MDFPQPMRRGVLLRRYKRFLADVRFEDGREATVHVPNPGAMLGLNAPGSAVWCSDSGSATRKLPLTLELVEAEGGLVGVNAHNPNKIVAEALRNNAVPELTGYATVRPEVKYGEASRIDFLLEAPSRPPCWLEVKNVHFMRTPGLAEFPDCVAARSAKHLRELEAMVAQGHRAVQLFVIQRMDADRFDTAGDIDKTYHAALRHAFRAGVEVLCYDCTIDPAGVTLRRQVVWVGANGSEERSR
jgi:sugar fermentation stimulation protein A